MHVLSGARNKFKKSLDNHPLYSGHGLLHQKGFLHMKYNLSCLKIFHLKYCALDDITSLHSIVHKILHIFNDIYNSWAPGRLMT